MAPTRRQLLGATALTIGLAGCAGSRSDGGGSSGSPTPTATETAAPETTTAGGTTTTGGGMASVAVEVADHPDYGDILVDGEGMTLYMFDPDGEHGGSASACSGGCAEAWPPLTVEGSPTAGDGVTAELTTFEREDGSTQIVANGWPLYYWQDDEEPGDATGQGVNDVWWVLRPDGTPVRTGASGADTVAVETHPDYGEILVDGEGMTLYMFDSDEQGSGSSTCSGGCADAWPPLTVEESPTAGEAVSAELTFFEREDGSTQVAANGWPLYYWADDGEPGDATGQGVNDVWWVMDPSGEPIREVATTSGDGGSGSSGGAYRLA